MLLAGLTGDGIAEIKLDGSWSIDGHGTGVPEGVINDLLQTDSDLRTPVLWLALEHAGVARREAGVWSTFDERSGLPNHVVNSIGAIAVGQSHQPWIGTASGAVIWRNNAWTPGCLRPTHIRYSMMWKATATAAGWPLTMA